MAVLAVPKKSARSNQLGPHESPTGRASASSGPSKIELSRVTSAITTVIILSEEPIAGNPHDVVLWWGQSPKGAGLPDGKPSITGFCIGAVVGLVAITPASGFVEPYAAIIIGAIAGSVANVAAYLRSKTQFDDSLDVVDCHGLGGFVGTILTGFLASKAVNPAGVDGSMEQVFIQLKGSVAGLLFSFVLTFVILKAIDLTIGLRPSELGEARGLDSEEHGEAAYIQEKSA